MWRAPRSTVPPGRKRLFLPSPQRYNRWAILDRPYGSSSCVNTPNATLDTIIPRSRNREKRPHSFMADAAIALVKCPKP